MPIRVRVDQKGRIVLPKNIREYFSIKEGDELIITIRKDEIVIKKQENPFKILEEILGDLTFSRELRKIAEKKALELTEEV